MRRVASQKISGMHYGLRVQGKHLFRIREEHIKNNLIPMIAKKQVGAVKLDLLLRGVGLLPEHAQGRAPGTVLPRYSYTAMHDLLRGDAMLGDRPAGADDDDAKRKLKRKWIGEQLAILEGRRLVKRDERAGRRPLITVLCDDGSGEPLDDPDGTPGNEYATILGGVLAGGIIRGWGAPEVCAYLAAMIAERQHDISGRLGGDRSRPGTGKWFRPLGWFADKENFYAPLDRRRFDFSTSTLRRGLDRLQAEDLVRCQRITRSPVSGAVLSGPRNLYQNRFGTLNDAAGALPLDEYLQLIEQVDEPDADR